jgi:dienelactone hydrolase
MKKSTKYIVFILFSSILFSQEKITFSSANPFGLKDIITALNKQKKQEVEGILRFPKGEGPFPLVLGVAGSLDWSIHHLEYLEMYRSMGIATFEVKSFSSRNVTSTVGSQTEVTTSMMILDAYKAFEKLANDPRIDKNRVAITGWSLGGGVALFSGWLPLVEKITNKVKFAAHLSIYPPCIVEPEVLRFTDAPMHIMIGALDDWVPAAACEELVPKIKDSGANIGLTVFPDSHHSFDKDTPLSFKENAYKTVDCRFKMNKDGAVLMNFLSIPMTTPLRQKIGLALCAERGTTMGGNPKTRKEAFQLAKEFMGKHLLDN